MYRYLYKIKHCIKPFDYTILRSYSKNMQRTKKFFKRKCIVYKIVTTLGKDFFSQSEEKSYKNRKAICEVIF